MRRLRFGIGITCHIAAPYGDPASGPENSKTYSNSDIQPRERTRPLVAAGIFAKLDRLAFRYQSEIIGWMAMVGSLGHLGHTAWASAHPSAPGLGIPTSRPLVRRVEVDEVPPPVL